MVVVENHDGTAWQNQVQMSYDGLGNTLKGAGRLFMTAWAGSGRLG